MFAPEAIGGFIANLTVNVAGLTEEAAKSLMVRTATAAKERVQRGTPSPSDYRQIVDGREGAPLTAVRADGTIIFAWSYAGEVVKRIYELMVAKAPRLKGQYIRGLLVMADGRETAPTAIPAGAAAYHVVASVPYARRLEVGKRRNGRPFVIQVPMHNVEATAIEARKLFGTLADISYTYVDLAGAHQLRRPIRRGRRVQTEVRYPAIRIAPRAA